MSVYPAPKLESIDLPNANVDFRTQIQPFRFWKIESITPSTAVVQFKHITDGDPGNYFPVHVGRKYTRRQEAQAIKILMVKTDTPATNIKIITGMFDEIRDDVQPGAGLSLLGPLADDNYSLAVSTQGIEGPSISPFPNSISIKGKSALIFQPTALGGTVTLQTTNGTVSQPPIFNLTTGAWLIGGSALYSGDTYYCDTTGADLALISTGGFLYNLVDGFVAKTVLATLTTGDGNPVKSSNPLPIVPIVTTSTPLTRAITNAPNGAGITQVVAGVAGKKIYVFGYTFMAFSGGDAQLQDNAGTPLKLTVLYQGPVLDSKPISAIPYFVVGSGLDLDLKIVAGQADVSVDFIQA